MDSFSPDIYTLEDENGEQKTFELLDTLEEDGNIYYALVPVYDESEKYISGDAELVVLKLEDPNSEDETLITIDDDDEYERIGAIFLERIGDYYDSDVEDEEYEEDE